MSGARFWTVGLLVLVACAADLFSSRTGLTVSAPLVLNEGVTLEVEDPEELANHTRDAAAPVLTATSLTGSAAFVRPEGVVGVWKAYRVGTTIKFGMIHATTVVLR